MAKSWPNPLAWLVAEGRMGIDGDKDSEVVYI
jgi:hypothetical protein